MPHARQVIRRTQHYQRSPTLSQCELRRYAHTPRQTGKRVGKTLVGSRHLAFKVAADGVRHRCCKGVLVVEVIEEAALCHPGTVDDLVNRDRVNRVIGKEVETSLQQRGTCPRRTGRGGSDIKHHTTT
jgi:hypothetical protein